MTIDEAVRNLDNLLIACDQSGREAWQTLKTAVLAQQTNNKPRAKSCRVCVGIRKGGPVYFTYCPGCGRYLGDKTSPVG